MEKTKTALAFLAAASMSALCAAQIPNASSSPAASAASATPIEGRISGVLTCRRPDPIHRVEAGEWPGHYVTASRTPCTWTKPAEINGLKTMEGYSAGSSDVEGTVNSERGWHVTKMSNGDRIYVAYRGKGILANGGAPISGEGTWNFKGGSGKLAKLQGMGTYRGRVGADGSMTMAIEGDYKIYP
jgi:hypothetical protein